MNNSKKLLIKKIYPTALTIIFIIVILYFTRNQWYQFNNIHKISVVTVIWLSILFIVMQLVYSYGMKILINSFNIKINLTTTFGLICMQSFGNYLPLNAGVAYSAGYLKIKNKLPVTKFVSLIAGSTILMVFTYGIIGIVLYLFYFIKTGNFDISVFLLLISFIIIGIIALFFPLRSFKGNNRIVKWLKNMQSGWEMIRINKILLFKVIIVHIITLCLLSFRFLLIFNDLNINIGIIGIIMLTIMTTLLRFNSIFPGNLGLREAVAGGVSKSFGFSFNIGVLAGIIDRIIAMFWIFLLGIFFSFVFLKKHKEK